MGILLSDKEKALAVNAEMERTKDAPDSMMDYSDTIAKAQLKKVVKWGNKRCREHPGVYGEQDRHYCGICWKALLKEIE